MPITAQNSTAVTTMDSVVIVSGHSPIMSMKASASDREDRDAAAGRAPGDERQHGREQRASARIQKARRARSSTCVIGHCSERKNGRKLGTSQSRTKLLTQSSNGMVRMSEGLNMASPVSHVGRGRHRQVLRPRPASPASLAKTSCGATTPIELALAVGDGDRQAALGERVELEELRRAARPLEIGDQRIRQHAAMRSRAAMRRGRDR